MLPVSTLKSLHLTKFFLLTSLLLVMALPWRLLWIVKLSRKEKLAIASIIGLGMIIVVFAIIRIIVTNTSGTHPEVIWLALWSSIETSVAVVVVCLTSFKVFLRKSGQSRSGYRSQQYAREAGFSKSKDIGEGERTGPIPLDNVTASGAYDNAIGQHVGDVAEGETASNNSKEILVR